MLTSAERFARLAPDKLTPKENYMRLYKGEDIEYIPTHTFFGMPVHGERTIAPFGTCTMLYKDDFYPGADKFHDDWGVEYTSVPSANGSFIPSGTHTNDYLIKDITHWQDQIWKPCLYDGIDWKAKAEEDLKDFDRSQTAVVCGSPWMPFQQIMAMMGFNEGLIAMYEEPEKIHEIMRYCMDYLKPHMEANIEYYRPDFFYILDDTSTARSPFISQDMFEEMILPYYLEMTETCRERGIPVLYHNCGRCEDFLPVMVEKVGVRYWDPAQPQNDLHGLQQGLCKDFNFNFIGGFTWHAPENWSYIVANWGKLSEKEMADLEEHVRREMRANIDEFGPGGHFLPAGSIIGPGGDPLTKPVNEWLADESYLYRREFMLK